MTKTDNDMLCKRCAMDETANDDSWLCPSCTRKLKKYLYNCGYSALKTLTPEQWADAEVYYIDLDNGEPFPHDSFRSTVQTAA